MAVFADYSSKAKRAPLPAPSTEDELAGVAFRRTSPCRLWIPSLEQLARHRVDASSPLRVGRKLFPTGTLKANRIDLWDPYYPAIVIAESGDGVWIGDDHGVEFPWGPIPFEEYLWDTFRRGFSARTFRKLQLGVLRP